MTQSTEVNQIPLSARAQASATSPLRRVGAVSHVAAHCQAEAEGLTLLKADNTTGYFGVNLHNPGKPKP